MPTPPKKAAKKTTQAGKKSKPKQPNVRRGNTNGGPFPDPIGPHGPG